MESTSSRCKMIKGMAEILGSVYECGGQLKDCKITGGNSLFYWHTPVFAPPKMS